MQTKLDTLLVRLDPDKTITETFNRANEAINTFSVDRAQIIEWAQFERCLCEFTRHVLFSVLQLRTQTDVSLDFYWSHYTVPALRQVYGPSGTKAAFEMARTGNDGGLYTVLRRMSMRVAEDYCKREIAARVSVYLESLSVGEQMEACSDYLDKYGVLLPSELTEDSAARIRADFGKVLKQHPWLLKKVHEVGR